MNDVKREFVKRVDEIELYFSFLENNITKEAKLIYPDNTVEEFPNDLNKIFKANCFLILYNLAESSVTNAIEAIYTHLENENVCYDDLRFGIKNEIVKYLKTKINANKFIESTDSIAYDIITQCFNPEKLLSGNLDYRKVKGIAEVYGFSHSILPMIEPDGTHLPIDSQKILSVKSKRNDLTHGIYSFTECGKEYTLLDLISIKNHIIEYLRQVINHIETYILEKKYLAKTV